MVVKVNRLIGYARVSTQKQGRSGLGLEGQKAALDAYAKANGGTIVKLYVEIETGKRADRPQLAAALAHAKCIGATLVVAKLDRLARNVAFLSSLMESGCDFVACDDPHANRLTIHILAAVAEDEAIRISERTKAALTAYKARGGLLGASLPQCRNLTPVAQQKGAEAGAVAMKQLADEAYTHLLPIIQTMRGEGQTLEAIAAKLNGEGYTTRRGKEWNHVQVKRVIDRAEKRRTIFKELVAADERGTYEAEAPEIARRYGLTENRLIGIFAEGLEKQWPKQ